MANTYQNFSDDELIEVYHSMMEYSGQPNEDLLTEINYRGGIDSFQKKIIHRKNVAEEADRITNKVYDLCRNSVPLDQIKKQLTSNSLSEQELTTLIDSKFIKYHQHKIDTTINSTTIVRCAAAGILATSVGCFIWGIVIKSANEVNNIAFAGIAIIIFVIVQYVSGKSTNNILVFATAFLSILVTYFLGLWVASLL